MIEINILCRVAGGNSGNIGGYFIFAEAY